MSPVVMVAITEYQTDTTARIQHVANVGSELGLSFARPHFLTGRVLARLNRLEAETQVPDWDDLGGRPIPTSVWVRTLELCTQIAAGALGLSDPFPSPCGDGSVHVRWTTPAHGELILEVRANEEVQYTCVSPDGQIEVGRWEPGEDVPSLAVQKLT